MCLNFVDCPGKAKAAEGEQLWSVDLYLCTKQKLGILMIFSTAVRLQWQTLEIKSFGKSLKLRKH